MKGRVIKYSILHPIPVPVPQRCFPSSILLRILSLPADSPLSYLCHLLNFSPPSAVIFSLPLLLPLFFFIFTLPLVLPFLLFTYTLLLPLLFFIHVSPGILL